MPEAHERPSLTRLRSFMPAVALSTIVPTGCMLDLNKLAIDLKKPDVTFAHADQWRCEEEVKIPAGNSVETCSRCVNASREPQPGHCQLNWWAVKPLPLRGSRGRF